MKTLKAIGITMLIITGFILAAIGIIILPDIARIIIAIIAWIAVTVGIYAVIKDAL